MWEIHGNLASARHFCFSVMELLICAPFISILLHAQIIRCLQVKERTTPLTSPFVQLAQYFRSVHNRHNIFIHIFAKANGAPSSMINNDQDGVANTGSKKVTAAIPIGI